jgi:hypothetical protein
MGFDWEKYFFCSFSFLKSYQFYLINIFLVKTVTGSMPLVDTITSTTPTTTRTTIESSITSLVNLKSNSFMSSTTNAITRSKQIFLASSSSPVHETHSFIDLAKSIATSSIFSYSIQTPIGLFNAVLFIFFVIGLLSLFICTLCLFQIVKNMKCHQLWRPNAALNLFRRLRSSSQNSHLQQEPSSSSNSRPLTSSLSIRARLNALKARDQEQPSNYYATQSSCNENESSSIYNIESNNFKDGNSGLDQTRVRVSGRGRGLREFLAANVPRQSNLSSYTASVVNNDHQFDNI